MKVNLIKHKFLLIAIAFSGTVYGYDIGITAGALLFIHQYYQLSPLLASLFAASFFAGITTSILFIGSLSDRLGRRTMLRIAPSIVILSAIYMTFTHLLVGLIITRYCLGVASAIISVNAPTYLSETVSPKHRGKVIASFQLFICFGIFIATAISLCYMHNSSWQFIFLYEVIPAILLLLATFMMPESLRWLNIKKSTQHEKRISASFIHQIFKNKRYFLATFLALALSGLNQLTGINAILQYDSTILLSAGFGQHELALGGVLMIVSINFIATIASMFYIDKIERKKILRIAIIGLLISLVILMLISFYILPGHLKGTLMLIAMLSFVACFALGPGALIWAITAEILPAVIRGRGMAIAQCTSSLASSTLILLFLPLEKHLGYTGLFACCGLFATLYFMITFFLPNTTGQALEHIEEQYLKR